MAGKTPRARKDQQQRMHTIAYHCGCLPCLLRGYLDVHTTIEHATEHGRRMARDHTQHDWTIGLCVWHHFAHTKNHRSKNHMFTEFGAPIGWRTMFEEDFGDEIHVLVPTQDFMLELFAAAPWPEFSVPRQVARDVRFRWIDLNTKQSTSAARSRSKLLGRGRATV